MKYFALINNNLVDGVVLAEDSFLLTVEDEYDLVIDVTDIDRPSLGDSYYPETQIFVSNQAIIIDSPIIEDGPHLHEGTEDSFEPFNLSAFSVSYNNGMVMIGCKEYSAILLLDALYKILINNETSAYVFTAAEGGPAHGRFVISWEDAELLYNALKTVRL